MKNNRLKLSYKLLSLISLAIFTVIMCICTVHSVNDMHTPGTHCAIGAMMYNTVIWAMLSSMFIVMIDIIIQVLVKDYRKQAGKLLRYCKFSIWTAYIFFNLTLTNLIIAYKHNKLVSIETNTEFSLIDTMSTPLLWLAIFIVFGILSLVTMKKSREEIDNKQEV